MTRGRRSDRAAEVEAFMRGTLHGDSRRGEDVPVGYWYPPSSVELGTNEDGDRYLIASSGWNPKPLREIRPTDKLLTRFVALAVAADEEIARFAETYGTLRLCEKHSLPLIERGGSIVANVVFDYTAWATVEDRPVEYHHNPNSVGRNYDECCKPITMADEGAYGTLEWLDDWRTYAAAAGALIRLAAAINDGQDGADTDWADVGVDSTCLVYGTPLETLQAVVNRWIRMADLRLGIGIERDEAPRKRWTLAPVLRTDALFTGIVSEVISAVAAPGRYAFCSECGVLFAPDRKPNPARRRFCQDCGSDPKVAQRHASRDYRARKRTTKQPVSTGNGESQ